MEGIALPLTATSREKDDGASFVDTPTSKRNIGSLALAFVAVSP